MVLPLLFRLMHQPTEMLLEPSTLPPGVYIPAHYDGLNNWMAEPFSSTMYLDVSRVFLLAWVVRFGSPSDIHSDGCSQFIPRALVGTDKNSGHAGSPQLTILGVVQTCHWSLNAALRVVLSVSGGVWKPTFVSGVILQLGTTSPQLLSCLPPFSLLFCLFLFLFLAAHPSDIIVKTVNNNSYTTIETQDTNSGSTLE